MQNSDRNSVGRNLAMPSIAVVIPTRNRASLVPRAVKSALEQTLAPTEVIVVIDGPDSATVAALEMIEDKRLRVIALDESGGGAAARNRGVHEAESSWIAFLDDDDIWLSDKLANQAAFIISRVEVSDRFISLTGVQGVTGTKTYHWPGRYPEANEPIAEYLFCHKSLFVNGESVVALSLIHI